MTFKAFDPFDPDRIADEILRAVARKPEIVTLDTIAADLVAELRSKRLAYGNSTGTTAEIMRLLLPDGAKPERYEDVQFAIRIIDKIKRRLTSGAGDDEDAVRDTAGYALLWLERVRCK